MRHRNADRTATHSAFHQGFLWSSLAMALGGFAIGAHLSFVLGLGFPVGQGLGGYVQLHGHLQLLGWVGLMIMGISLHFVPRLAGVPIARPHWCNWIVWCMTTGLAGHGIGHAVIPYLTAYPVVQVFTWLMVVAGGLEAGGIILYVGLLLRTCWGAVEAQQRQALLTVRPYFGMMLVGWVVYAGGIAGLLLHMALTTGVILHPAWFAFATQSFQGLVLLPVALAFSLRMFPLYLRLAVPAWPVRGVAYGYLCALLLQLLPVFPPLAERPRPMVMTLSQLGLCAKGGIILWFIWKLDLLTRRRHPWTVRRKLHPDPERRPTRPGLPDYGEFGGFERLVYAAYLWLVLAAGCEILAGVAGLLHRPWFVSGNTVRHMYLLGFITLLIFGMAVRMLPGFFGKRRVAHAALVEATFWLGNAAVVCRVLPFVIPPGVLQDVPGLAALARTAFAVSGLLGLAAVCCLAINLWRTLREA